MLVIGYRLWVVMVVIVVIVVVDVFDVFVQIVGYGRTRGL